MDSAPILDGIRVIDMTQYLAGPTVTRLLAELGADVIKIEQAPYGDPTRGYAMMSEGRSGYFVQQNRGKRSLCIDFDEPRGRALLDQLIEGADVLVENYGPGVLEKRNLDWASVSTRNQRLIMASVSGFGRNSAYSDRVAFDLIAQAQSGMLHMTGERDGPPQPMGSAIGDVNAGVHAVAGIGMALFHRERTGNGQHVDIAMVDALFHMHENSVHGPPLTGMRWRPRRAGHQSRMNAPMGVYKGPEGWIVVQVMERQWPGFCRAIGRPELETDERFANLDVRQKNREELHGLLDAWMATQPSDDVVIASLEAERVPCAKVIEPIEALGHPHYESRQAIRTVPDPILGEIVVPGNPLRMSAQPDQLDLLAPLLGEHNAEILAELGCDEAAITAMTADGVLNTGDR